MTDQANAIGEMEAIDQIANLLGPEEGEPEDEQESGLDAESQEDETTQSESEDSEGDDESLEAEPVEEFEEITWNGETKKVPKSELKELAQKGFDYTQKTQSLAQERRAFEAQVRAAQEQAQLQQASIDVIAEVKGIDAQLEQFNQVNWHQLAQDDPANYIQLHHRFSELKEARNNAIGKFQQVSQQVQMRQQQHMHEVLQEQAQKLAEKMPELAKAESKAALKSYLIETGFTDAEVSGLTDHRAAILAYKAMKYDQLQKAKPAITKKTAEVPKVLKPSNKPPKSRTADDMALLRKTGNKDVAQRLIESML